MMARLAEELRDSISADLESRGATRPCARCGHDHVTFLDGYSIEFVQTQTRNMVVGGDNRVTCVATVCDRCGAFSQHILEVLQGTQTV
jgi:hypothetical protein